MNHLEALAAISGHPHASEFARLCRDGNTDIEQRDAYRSLVVHLAAGTLPQTTMPAITTAEIRRQLSTLAADRRRASACPFREPCGCAAARCSYYQRLVTVPQCIACLDASGPPANRPEVG